MTRYEYGLAGRRPETVKVEPFRFDQMRRGCWDIHARIRDMDINGVWASLNYPSGVTGFGGTLFSEMKDQEFGLACVRAWNDWLFEEWYTPYPDRIIPLGLTYLTDPELGAVRMTAATPRLTATPAAVRWAGPPLGAHNAEVYGALGISRAELEHLERDGIL